MKLPTITRLKRLEEQHAKDYRFTMQEIYKSNDKIVVHCEIFENCVFAFCAFHFPDGVDGEQIAPLEVYEKTFDSIEAANEYARTFNSIHLSNGTKPLCRIRWSQLYPEEQEIFRGLENDRAR